MFQPEKPVIFFDGICGLCNHFVDFLLRVDKKKQFYFAPLQGLTSKDLISANFRTLMQTVVFYNEKSQVLSHSTAVIEIMLRLGGIYKIFYLAYLCPRIIRDFIYLQISKNRYRLFGKRSSCRLPNKDEKLYFLD